jgi:FkbH-like protein
MHTSLKYPFDINVILQKRRKIKKEILASEQPGLEKHIAILGGSTTHDIKEILELFLLNFGIGSIFYESEYGQYWQDAMFGNPTLEELKPDIIFIHTSNRNITAYPTVKNSFAEIDKMLDDQYRHFEAMWERLYEKYNCPIIQNNFEMPFYRLLGNKDASDIHGRTNYLSRLNSLFYKFAQKHSNFYINDINYLSASYGLEKWSDPLFWHMYKYCLCVSAIPYLSFSVANIIKSLFGKNKKAIILDLDNTLWGGIVGEDGVEGIEIGCETSMGQVYSEFQTYIKAHKDLGIMLNINSKNDYENAIAGLNHPEGTLRPDDFIIIKANWQNKDMNTREIALELNIFPDNFVFIDDNPVERGIVTAQIPGVVAPAIDKVENYIHILDKSGFFEVTNFSEDDINRNEMYRVNLERTRLEQGFDDYEEYLKSLDMVAIIKDFDDIYIQRITQLINKTNQFNLTAKRLTQSEMDAVAVDERYIRLYGKLADKFGDNGIVTVVVGKKDGIVLDIELWLMSCRVLKRNLEHAMLDVLVEEAKKAGIKKIKGYYYQTLKNGIVKNFYETMGFVKVGDDCDDSVWELDVVSYENLNNVMRIMRKAE